MDKNNETSTAGYPKSTNGFTGNTNARSKLELMRKQFVSKQAVRTAQARQKTVIAAQGDNTDRKSSLPRQTHISSGKNVGSSTIGRKDARIGRQKPADHNVTSESLPKKKSEAGVSSKAEYSEDINVEVPASLNAESSDMREKMKKQHIRRPIHRAGVTYRVKDHDDNVTVVDQYSCSRHIFWVCLPYQKLGQQGQQKFKPPGHDSKEIPNENILNQIRAKGPMVVKNNISVTEVKAGKETDKANGTNSQTQKTMRASSPKLNPNRAQTGGRASPRIKRGASPVNHGQVRGRNPSPKGRNPSPLNRPPSPNTDGISPYSPEDTAKKVARVMKARLYLLQQNGPNSFRIGGDSLEHKFRIIVGPQTCSCGRAFCVHLLFVMLRVFKLDPSSPLLWRRKLKNFEVESLLRDYQDRCNSRISPKRKSRVKRMVNQISHGNQQQDTSSNSDDHSSKGEEENCPICLLQMIDDEPITVCEVGCRNKLHTHCVDIWAEECRRNADALKCPLCRVVWKPAETTRRPFMVEIPPEYEDTADNWVRAFGWELVTCLFSSHPNVRENGLRRLSHDITGALLTAQSYDVPDDHSEDSDRSSPRGAAADPEASALSTNANLSSCSAILAMVCADPEYRVYVTALRTLRAMLAYTQCLCAADVKAFQKVLFPVVETILLRCADSSRRVLQLSVSTVMELCKGQGGELAVGKEISASMNESLGVGDVDYFIGFLESERSPDSTSWQWRLGRLNVLNELFKEFKDKFTHPEGLNGDLSINEVAMMRLSKVTKFTADCLRISKHQNVVKMAHKVFVQAVNLGSKDSQFMIECMQLLQNLDYPRLRKRVAQFLPDSMAIPVEWENLSGSYDERNEGRDSWITGLATIKSPVLDSNPSAGEIGLASSIARYPSLTITSHRATFPSPSLAEASMHVASSPTINDDFDEELNHVHGDGILLGGSCAHPPTPPPSSDSTTNLQDAIQVSLFRPIRDMSPTPEVPSLWPVRQPVLDGRSKLQDYTNYDVDEESLEPPPLPAKEKKMLSETSKSMPTTPVSADPSQPEGRRQRPTLLRLRSEASAFRQTKGMVTASKKAGTPDSETSSSCRERSSSRESDSSASMGKNSDRRFSVKELAEHINRKHLRPSGQNGTKKDTSTRNYVSPQSKSTIPQPFERSDSMQESPTKPPPLPPPHTKPQQHDIPNDPQLTSNQKRPLMLASKYESHPISRNIARRGTMERYKEKKRLEGLSNPPQTLHEVKTPDAELPDFMLDTTKTNPPLNLYNRSTELSASTSRLRGILKNVVGLDIGRRPAPLPARQKSVTTDSGRASASSSDCLSEDKDVPNTVLSPCKSSDEFNCVFPTAYDDHRLEDGYPLIPPPLPPRPHIESGSDSDYVGSEKRFGNARDSLIDHHGTYKVTFNNGQAARPMRPKHLKRNAKSPTREAKHRDGKETAMSPSTAKANVTHVTESVPSKDGKESLFYVRTARQDEERPSTSSQRKLPALPDQPRSQSQSTNANTPESQVTLDDLESDTSQADKTPITFKSEIGDCTTPGDEVSNTTDFSAIVAGDYRADINYACSCQASIAEEESKLFAQVLAVSYVQDALPIIPHLSYVEYEEDIIRPQHEATPIGHEYRVSQHWIKGNQIGLGALSSCFQARDVFTGTLMAVKQVNYQRCSEKEQAQVLEVIDKEIEVMRCISHPNVVRLHGVTKELGMYNVFFEWCAGGSVSTLLSRYGAFTESVISNYTLQIFRGLAYLHERSIVHRDIKGANLLVDSTGQRLRIGDFGASARLATKATGAGEFQGQLLGTIAFMAPEVLRGEHYGRSCDVWSAGCVITEMATGRPPWDADQHSNHLSLIFKIASSPSTPIIPDHLSPAMRDLCKRCLETDPKERPPADDLLKHPVFIRW